MANKVYHSDPGKDKVVCAFTYNLLLTLRKLGLIFNIPIREVLIPLSLGDIMLDKFTTSFIRCDDD